MLDAQCKMPKGSDKGFNQAILKQHAANPHFSALSAVHGLKVKNVSDDEVFVIHHFAGDVVYHSHDFCNKNTDQLSAQFETEMKKSTVPFLLQMINGVATTAKPEKGDAMEIAAEARGGDAARQEDAAGLRLQKVLPA